MATIEPRLLKGFRDYLPDPMIVRRRMINSVCTVFERFGFSPLETPALEYTDILLGKMGDEAEKLLYRFRDNGDRDITLRYDLTVPLARVIGMNRNLPMPFKRYQVGNVWRAESPGRGRFREFLQCDVDIVGTTSLMADAECLAVDAAVMTALGVQAKIRFNNRKVFQGLQESIGVADGGQMNLVLRAVDKLPKIGDEGVRAELRAVTSLDAAAIDRVMAFCAIAGSPQDVLAQLESLFAASPAGQSGVAELREVLGRATSMGVPAEMLVLDPSIARGLDYYTGTVFETFLDKLPAFGSVMSGGRYDTLIGLYAGQEIPAVGISVGVDRLLAGLIELGEVSCPKSVTHVLLAALSESEANHVLGAAAGLRRLGVNAEVYLDPAAKVRKAFKYADSLGISWVAVAGPDEVAKNMLSLKDMKSGTQELVTVDEAARRILAAQMGR